MDKFCADSVLDAALDKIETSTRLLLLPSQPADLAAAEISKLGEIALDGGDFAKSAGAVSGRQVAVAAQTVSASNNGTVTHVGLVDDTALLYTTTTDAQAVLSGGIVLVASWAIELRAPT